MLAAKLADARDNRTIRLAWFGLGDNPFFKVGLADLHAYKSALAELARADLNVELTVLTNVRALDGDGLEQIRRLPVRTSIREWSEEAEEEVLARAFACVIPVNAQRFSVAKSLNRAVTALTAGCQVLSLGYPLYEPLGALIYRDPSELLRDLVGGRMRLSQDRLDAYREVVSKLASPEEEATAFAQFMGELASPSAPIAGPLTLIHGHTASGTAHQLVQALGGLSVASPFCTVQMSFDVLFKGLGAKQLQMLVSESAVGRLPTELRRCLRPSEAKSTGKYWSLPDAEQQPVADDSKFESADLIPLAFQLASFGPTLDRMRNQLRRAFGPSQIILSETAQLPFNWR
jgi:hypothetical protein